MYTIESLTGSPTLILRVLNSVGKVSTFLESRGDVKIGILVLLKCHFKKASMHTKTRFAGGNVNLRGVE